MMLFDTDDDDDDGDDDLAVVGVLSQAASSRWCFRDTISHEGSWGKTEGSWGSVFTFAVACAASNVFAPRFALSRECL